MKHVEYVHFSHSDIEFFCDHIKFHIYSNMFKCGGVKTVNSENIKMEVAIIIRIL